MIHAPFLLTLLAAGMGQSQWLMTLGPGRDAGSIRSLFAAGPTLFAGTENGLFRSDDKGEAWTSAGSPGSEVVAMAASGDFLFAASPGGVFRSRDTGRSWIIPDSTVKIRSVRALAVNGTAIFAGNADGVHRSVDSGVSWTHASTGLTDPWVTCLAASGTTLFAGTHAGGVFRSDNMGASWTTAGDGLPNKVVTSLSVVDSNLFAGTYNFIVYMLPLAGHPTRLRRPEETQRHSGFGRDGGSRNAFRSRMEFHTGQARVDAMGVALGE